MSLKAWADNKWLRAKRNEVEYDVAGGATDADAAELREFASALRKDVLIWLKSHHSELVP